MSNKRVSELVELPAANLKPDDLFLVTDTAVNVLESKKLKANDLKSWVLSGGSITGSITNAKVADTASYINANNVGLIKSASYSITSSYADTANSANNASTASYVNSSNIDGIFPQSEFSKTASYLDGEIVSADSASYTLFSELSKATLYLSHSIGQDNGLASRAINSQTASYLDYIGTPNGTASYALIAENCEFDGTASYLSYSGQGNGTASYSIVSETALETISASYARSSSYLYYPSDAPYDYVYDNGTASYAMRADYVEWAQNAYFGRYSETSSYAETASLSHTASFALQANFSGGFADYANTAGIAGSVIDPNVYRMWGPYEARFPFGDTTSLKTSVGVFNFNLAGDTSTTIVVSVLCDIKVPMSLNDLGEISLMAESLNIPTPGVFFETRLESQGAHLIDTSYPANVLSIDSTLTQISGALVISGHNRQSLTLGGSHFPVVSESLYRFYIEAKNGIEIDGKRQTRFYIYTKPTVTAEWRLAAGIG